MVTATTARSLAEQAYNTIKTADSIVASLVERVEAEGTGPEAKVRFYRSDDIARCGPTRNPRNGHHRRTGQRDRKVTCGESGRIELRRTRVFSLPCHTYDRGPFIGERVKSKIDGSYNTTVTRRIDHTDGSFAGVVVTSVSMKFFQQLFDQVRTELGGIIALLSDDGAILARSPAITSGASGPCWG